MPPHTARSSPAPAAVAPDGIPIHTFDLPAGAHVGVAEGHIPPGRYGVHRHLSLEQYTYVISGSVIVITGNDEHPIGRAVTLGAGDLLLTLPGESLQFVNERDEMARVLFICAPPYPPDNRDTHSLPKHRPMQPAESAAAIARLEAVRAELNATIDQRIAALRSPTES
jgi:mannose-6-phosphate isomerase-like protein (cupin superfamily)